MAKTTTVATNLLGRQVTINLGMPDLDYVLEQKRDPGNRYSGHRHLGRLCEVVAVYQDSERNPMLLLNSRSGEGLIEVHATHVRLS